MFGSRDHHASDFHPCWNCGELRRNEAGYCSNCGATPEPVSEGVTFLRIVGALVLTLMVLPLGALGICSVLVFPPIGLAALALAGLGIWGIGKLLKNA